jgi:dTDP-4-dehydrorhamnose reductase
MSLNKKIVLFGKNGQLGGELIKLLPEEELHAFDYPEVDFNDFESIEKILDTTKPGLVINAAAYTNVDGAESETELANTVNGHAVGLIARKSKEHQAGFIHFSTDFVFDGKKTQAYTETDQPNPINAYGASKLLGEEQTTSNCNSYLTFRLSWVYTLEKPSFLSKVLAWSKNNEVLKIVDDQVSNPTWAAMVAKQVDQIMNAHSGQWHDRFLDIAGIYHLTGAGSVSKYEWAKEIIRLNLNEQRAHTVLPVASSYFPTPAVRPAFSSLNCDKFERTFGAKLPGWRDSLIQAMQLA